MTDVNYDKRITYAACEAALLEAYRFNTVDFSQVQLMNAVRINVEKTAVVRGLHPDKKAWIAMCDALNRPHVIREKRPTAKPNAWRHQFQYAGQTVRRKR
jgi:hypothetical protein